MNKLFGTAKPKPTINMIDLLNQNEGREESLEKKINKLNEEIIQMNLQMSKMRDGPQKNNMKQKALNLLRRKKTYESQCNTISNQSFIIEQQQYTISSIKDTKQIVDGMIQGNNMLKKEIKTLDMNKMEDMFDDMSEMMQDTIEIQEIMNRSYGVPNDFDEADLEAELEGLGDMDLEGDLNFVKDLPIPISNGAINNTNNTNNSNISNTSNGIDEFGLPTYS